MIGFMQLEQGKETAVILEKMAVLPAHRHRGCGKMLLNYARQTAKAMGGSKLLAAIIEGKCRTEAVVSGQRLYPYRHKEVRASAVYGGLSGNCGIRTDRWLR